MVHQRGRPDRLREVRVGGGAAFGPRQRSRDLCDIDRFRSAGDRSPWAWVLLGVCANFAVLVPLAMLMMSMLKTIYQRGDHSRAWIAVAAVLCLCLSSTFGGYLVGRFGGKATPREGLYSGLLSGAIMWALSRAPMGFVIIAWTGPFAYLGAWLGRRARKPGSLST